MKKILSVMLAIMMLFGALSISASAEGIYDEMYKIEVPGTNTTVGQGGHLILEFNFGAGSSKLPLYVYENGAFTEVPGEEITGTYYMLPRAYNQLVAGASLELPTVKAPDDKDFRGWYCYADGRYYITGQRIETIPSEWFTANNGSRVVKFTAEYESAEPEADTLTTILGILSKVFGAMLGIFFFDGSTAQGVQLVEKLLAGIM